MEVFDAIFGKNAPLPLLKKKEVEFCPQCGEGEINKDGFCKECGYPGDHVWPGKMD